MEEHILSIIETADKETIENVSNYINLNNNSLMKSYIERCIVLNKYNLLDNIQDIAQYDDNEPGFICYVETMKMFYYLKKRQVNWNSPDLLTNVPKKIFLPILVACKSELPMNLLWNLPVSYCKEFLEVLVDFGLFINCVDRVVIEFWKVDSDMLPLALINGLDWRLLNTTNMNLVIIRFKELLINKLNEEFMQIYLDNYVKSIKEKVMFKDDNLLRDLDCYRINFRKIPYHNLLDALHLFFYGTYLKTHPLYVQKNDTEKRLFHYVDKNILDLGPFQDILDDFALDFGDTNLGQKCKEKDCESVYSNNKKRCL